MIGHDLARLTKTARPSAVLAGALTSALIAGLAALTADAMKLEVWIMLLGLLAYSSRGNSLRDGAANYVCLILGLILGMAAMTLTSVLKPSFGALALPTTVFLVTCLILPLRRVPVIDNLICYFLGVTAVIGGGDPPSAMLFLELAATTAIGTLSGWLAGCLQAHFNARA